MRRESITRVVDRLRRQGADDADYEAKRCARSLSKDVWESVSAFANTRGGVLLLGISEEDGFAPVEGLPVDRIRHQFLSGMGDGGSRGRLANPPQYSIKRAEIDGAPVLLINIEELDLSHKPCYIIDRGVQGGSYKRVDDADIPLSASEIHSLETAGVVTDSDRRIVDGASITDLDPHLLERTIARALDVAPRSLKGADDLETRLNRLNVTTGEGAVTTAGLLVLGSYPQQFFPKLHVDVAVHDGLAKGAGGEVRFLDRTACEGTLGEIVENAVQAVAKNLRRRSVVRGVDRIDEWEIPLEVLREAIVNALLHREYDPRFTGQAVAIDVYDDRIEVTNPGGLWGKSWDSLDDGRSCCRNATLLRLMSLVPSSGGAGAPAEGNGSGIPFMIAECLAHGLEPPRFRPAIDHFTVVLRRPGRSLADLRITDLHRADPSVASRGKEVLLEILEKYGELSVRELESASGLTVNQVRTRLRALLAEDQIEATAPQSSHRRKYAPKR